MSRVNDKKPFGMAARMTHHILCLAGKTAIGQRLAKLLGGRLINQVAPCLRRYSAQLLGSHPLRRPLQFLSLYATAFDAKVQIALDRPVVVNRCIPVFSLISFIYFPKK